MQLVVSGLGRPGQTWSLGLCTAGQAVSKQSQLRQQEGDTRPVGIGSHQTPLWDEQPVMGQIKASTHPCRPGSSSGAEPQQSGSRTWALGTAGRAQLHAAHALPFELLQLASGPQSRRTPGGTPASHAHRLSAIVQGAGGGWSECCAVWCSSAVTLNHHAPRHSQQRAAPGLQHFDTMTLF